MILSGDCLRLPADVHVAEGRLHDSVRRGSWPLNDSGRFIVGRAGFRVGEIASELAERWSIDRSAALRDVVRFSTALNELLLLNVERRYGRLALCWRWLRALPRTVVYGQLPPLPRSRRPLRTDSWAQTGVGVVRALMPAALGVSAAAAALLLTLSVAATARPDLGTTLLLPTAVGTALLVHEIGHALSLRGVPVCIALRGPQIMLLHPTLARSRRMLVALAGPALATAVGLLLLGLGSLRPELALWALPLGAQGLGFTVASKDGRTGCGLW